VKKVAGAIILIIICSMFSACTIGNVEFVFNEEVKKECLFTLGEYSDCTKEELAVYFLLAKGEYEEVFGTEVWQMRIDGISMTDFVKNNILTKALEDKTMSALAKFKGLVLSEEEIQDIKDAAEELYASYSGYSDENRIMASDIEKVFTDMRLAKLAFDYITKDVNTEISDAEAKVIEVQYIKCGLNGRDYSETLELMEEIHTLLCENDFDKIVSKYDDRTENAVIDVRKGDMVQITSDGEKLENKLFSLSTGDISDIIVVNDAMYIFKSIDDYNPDKTEENKSVILEERKKGIMQKEYDSFIDGMEYVFDEEMWENLHFEEYLE